MTNKKKRMDALEAHLGVRQQRTIGWCGHPGCAWKLPADTHNCIVVATGVPRPSCLTGDITSDYGMPGKPPKEDKA